MASGARRQKTKDARKLKLLARLERKYLSNQLEVEHLLRTMSTPDTGIGNALLELSERLDFADANPGDGAVPHKTADAVETIIAVLGSAEAEPGGELEVAGKAASVINLIMSFKGAPELGADVEIKVREFLHRLIRSAGIGDALLATAVLALRGVGNRESIELLKSIELGEPWEGSVSTAQKAIRKRLRKRR